MSEHPSVDKPMVSSLDSTPSVKESLVVKHLLTPIAAGLTAIYLALAVQAAVCLFAHAASQVGGHHHHPDKAAHSVLCVWACQANSEPSLASMPPVIPLLLLGGMFVPIPSTRLLGVRFDCIRSRAPPR
jgi:hypothetical protein